MDVPATGAKAGVPMRIAVISLLTAATILLGGVPASGAAAPALSIPVGQPALTELHNLAVDSAGNVYVTQGEGAVPPTVAKLSPSGTEVWRAGVPGSGPGQFRSGSGAGPYGVAVDGTGNVLVADRGNHRIQKFDANGNFVMKFGSLCHFENPVDPQSGCVDPDGAGPHELGDGQFFTPLDVAMDGAAAIYVADDGAHRVQKFDANGNFVRKFGSRCYLGNPSVSGCVDPDDGGPLELGDGQFFRPCGVAVASSGEIFVSDCGNNRVQKFSAGGAFLLKFGSSGSGQGQFAGMGDLAIDGGGNIHVADGNGRVQRFSPGGSFQGEIQTRMPGDLTGLGPSDVGFDAVANVYVAERAMDRIQVFSSAGSRTAVMGTRGVTDGRFWTPEQLALDSAGNIYVADGAHRVQKFDPTGTLLLKATLPGFQFPVGVAPEPGGGMVVTESGNPKVSRLDASGHVTERFGIEGNGTGYISGFFTNTVGLAVAPNGDIETIEAGGRFNSILSFDSEGDHRATGSLPDRSVDPFTGQSVTAYNAQGGLAIDGFGRRIFGLLWQTTSTIAGRVHVWGAGGAPGGTLAPGGHCGGPSSPTGLAVDNANNIYVSDFNNCVVKYDANLQFVRTIDGQFSGPTDVAVDPFGNVYVADANNFRVQKFGPAGDFLRMFGSSGTGNGEFGFINDLAVDASGNLYVADDTERIQKFDSSGNFIRVIGGTGSAEGEFKWIPRLATVGNDLLAADPLNNRVQKFDAQGNPILTTQFRSPAGIVRDSAGNFFVVDRPLGQVQKVDPTGKLIVRFGNRFGTQCNIDAGGCDDPDGAGPLQEGDGQFFQPTHLALDPDGNVLVLDRNNNRIAKFDANGQFLEHFKSGLLGPSGLAVDAAGNVYIADGGYEEISLKRFGPNGAFHGSMGSWGVGPGRLASVGGIAVDGSGRIYVSDSVNTRVQVFSQWDPGNQPPAVSAGPDVSGDEGTAIALDGSVTDPESDAFVSVWTDQRGVGAPFDATCSFGNAEAVDTTITCTDPGVYRVTLAASDGMGGATVKDHVNVLVTDPAADGKVCFDPVGNLAAAGWRKEGDGSIFGSGPLQLVDSSSSGHLDVVCDGAKLFESTIILTPSFMLDFGFAFPFFAGEPGLHVTINDGVREVDALVFQERGEVRVGLGFLAGDHTRGLTLPRSGLVEFELRRRLDGTAILRVPGQGQEVLRYEELPLSARGNRSISFGSTVGATGSTSWYTLGLPLANAAPSVDAGADAIGTEGNPIALDASSADPDGDDLALVWAYQAGAGVDAGATCSFTDRGAEDTSITCTDDGTYTVRLTADDGAATASDTAVVTVVNAAPTVGALTGSAEAAAVGTPVELTTNFTDSGANDAHTAEVAWGDGTTSTATVTETNGSHRATASHSYTAAGIYTLTTTVSDDDDGSGQGQTSVIIFRADKRDSAAFAGTLVTGLGKTLVGTAATFTNNGTPACGLAVTVFPSFLFTPKRCDWLAIFGARAIYQGAGRVNGSGDYGFLVYLLDGHASGAGGQDKLRIKIWNQATAAVVLDTQAGAATTAEPATAVSGIKVSDR